MSSNPNPNPYTGTGTGTHLSVGSFWRGQCEYAEERGRRLQESIHATCEALGAAGFFLSSSCYLSNTDRLVAIADVLNDLRTHLGLPIATHTPTDTTNDTPASDSGDSNGGERA